MGNYLNWPWVFHSFSSQALFTYSVWISALLVESKNRNKKLHGNFIVRSINYYFNECSRRIFGTLLQTAQLPFAGQSARVFFSFSLSSSSFSHHSPCFWDKVSPWALGRSMSPRDLLASTSPVLVSQVHTFTPGFFCGYWGQAHFPSLGIKHAISWPSILVLSVNFGLCLAAQKHLSGS